MIAHGHDNLVAFRKLATHAPGEVLHGNRRGRCKDYLLRAFGVDQVAHSLTPCVQRRQRLLRHVIAAADLHIPVEQKLVHLLDDALEDLCASGIVKIAPTASQARKLAANKFHIQIG